MPLNRFKTQVLLLHSELSTLEQLGAGFDERYTVHFATSGSEALQTLGETPIDVIVSAQELPGMSGIEALHEAKRRSPETVGILLAGNLDEGQEALVSDTEIFEVVRGNVTSDIIINAVDSATQNLRMMTLKESANDTAADARPSPDELVNDEHIIMETTADGQAVITDASGRVPVLDPNRATRAATGLPQSVAMLVLTKDQEFLTTIKKSTRGGHGVHHANTLAEADEIIRERAAGVTVIDAGMIGKRIEQLIEYLRRGSPRLVFIVAGRRDDGDMLMDLINRGKVYRFLLKPVSPGRARLAIEASAKHHLHAPDAVFADRPSAVATELPAANDESQVRTSTSTLAAPAALQQGSTGDSLGGVFGSTEAGLGDTLSDLFRTINEKLLGHEEPDAIAGAPAASTTDREPPTTRFAKKGTVLTAIAVAAIVAIGYLWFAGSPDEGTTVKQTVTSPAPAAQQPPARQVAVPQRQPDQALPAAEMATVLDSERIADPVFEAEAEGAADAETLAETSATATDGERAADQDAPASAPFEDENSELVAAALAGAERALLESRLDDVDAALQQISLIDPDNTRLAFLGAQVTQARWRAQLADARNAILETRFDDAEQAIANARAMNIAEVTETNTVLEELRAARSQKLAEDVLTMANDRLQSGALIAPPDNNARYFFELALVNDPANTTAREGLSVIASKLALQARAATDKGDLDAAQGLLRSASTLEPANNEVLIAQKQLARVRSQAAAQKEDRIAETPAPQPGRAAAAAPADTTLAPAVAETGADGMASVAEVASDAVDTAAQTAAANGAAAQEQQDAEAVSTASTAVPVMVSSLNRLKYVAPKYPRAAQRRNLSGWVDVLFTVQADGTVKNVEVQASEPGDVFASSAVRAVEKWEFEPVVENGAVVEKRVGVRMMFALE